MRLALGLHNALWPVCPVTRRLRICLCRRQRSLDDQGQVIDGLRTRASAILAAASIAASFLGGIALDDDAISGFGVGAVVAFAAVGIFTLVILYPYEWTFRFRVPELLDGYVEGSPAASMARMHRELAVLHEDSYQANKRKLGRLFVAFQVAVFGLAGMVLLWLMELAISGGAVK